MRLALLAGLLLLAGCGDHARAPARSPAAVAVDRTFPVASGIPAGAVLWLHPQDAARSLVLGATGAGGLALYGLDGQSRSAWTTGVVDFVSLAYGFDAGNGPAALVVAHDRTAGALRIFTVDAGSLQLRELGAPLPLRGELTGLCLYRSAASARYYAFAATGEGELQQWELYAHGGQVSGRIVRSLPVGAGAGYCAVDDAESTVYVADEGIGIWRMAAEPEADTGRELLDLTAPRGALGDEVKGLAILQGATAKYLLAADEDAAAVHVYALADGKPAGAFTLASADGAKFESLWAGGFAPAPRQSGVVLVADQRGPGGAAFRLLRWDAITAALHLPATTPIDPRVTAGATMRAAEPAVETRPVDDYGDAADDPAIWIDAANPAKSLIIGAQKKRGIEVYDLAGQRAQLLADGRINNVDLRQGVELGGRTRDIVAGSNRDTKTLALYEMNPATRQLQPAAAAPIPSGFGDPYGLCMYHSAQSGKLYVFINDPDRGDFRQWEIDATAAGLTATLKREFTVGSQAEGCAADDETGALYIAEEDVGLWRYAAEPDGGEQRTQIDSTGTGGHLQADVEGVAIFRGAGGAGFLIVSNQGADNYAVYRREANNAFVGHFSIAANDALGIDGASETDGLDVTSTPLGNGFAQGLLVVQDGRNITPAERQNFKLVPWERVKAALGL